MTSQLALQHLGHAYIPPAAMTTGRRRRRRRTTRRMAESLVVMAP